MGSQRLVQVALSIAVIGYSASVLWEVAGSGSIGLRCVLGPRVQDDIPDGYDWKDDRGLIARPKAGDTIVGLDGRAVDSYPDVVHFQRRIRDKIGERVRVSWKDAAGEQSSAWATVRARPLRSYQWSFVWIIQELAIFWVGFRVVWNRPRDGSAWVFFWLCVVTVGAYLGGYHWTEIVVSPTLIYLFALFAVLLPVISLHFYLVFPSPRPIYARRKWLVLGLLYGGPLAYLAAIWASMTWTRRLGDAGDPNVGRAVGLVASLSLGYVGVAFGLFGLCLICLMLSYRQAKTRAERNQVKYILLASLLALPPIGFMLRAAAFDPAALGRSSSAWPMFAVSLLYTSAYAMSITRYRLMQVEEVLNRSVRYFLVSLVMSLLYSAALVVGSLMVGLNLQADQYSREAVLVAATAVLILILSGMARERFQKVIDKQFYREKYKLDQAMRKMSLAVGSLVDRSTLGNRLLEAADEVLRLEWGAIYLGEPPEGPLTLAAWHGSEPEERTLAAGNPLVGRLREVQTVRVPHAMALSGGADPATDAMIALGGEVAGALEAEGGLAGLIVLGPKRNGLPYEDEEIAFLGALASVAALALHSSEIQQTLEGLNGELRDKVEKIAEQQRRILILQDQLMGRAAEDHAIDEAGRREVAEPSPGAFDAIKGSGPAVRTLIEVARKVAASNSAVLIRGESGTGKELLAQAIHAASPRSAGPFVRVHCAALSPSLLESELFGHVKSAFTGADRDRVGRFELADGGTVFLDEIGDITLEVQTKLLRVLQQRSFERVGSSQSIQVDVRVVAATHQDLEALIAAGRFREDLFYRLNVIPIRTPSLRDRRDDVFELALHFLGVHARREGKQVTRLENDAVEALAAYDWPGNVRELENAIERAVVLADGPVLTLADFPPEVRSPSSDGRRPRFREASRRTRLATPTPRRPTPAGVEPVEDGEFTAYERRRLLDALDEAGQNKSEAARLLGMPRSTFFSKLKKHGLDRESPADRPARHTSNSGT